MSAAVAPWRLLRKAVVIAGVAIAASAGPAAGQDYPAREIRSICNFPAGSGADVLVRFFSDRLSKLAGRPVVVENRPGAQGNIATEAVARSKPDGYTIMITPASSTLATAPHVFKSIPFDPVKDFAPVTTVARLAFVIAVDASKPIRTVPELVDYLKTRPGDGAYGSASNSGQIAGELFKEMAKLRTTYVPYIQPMQGVGDLLLGQTDFLSYDATFAYLQSTARGGKLRILAQTAPQRTAALPDVPTMEELGYKGFDVTPWWGVVVPAGTPRPIIDRLAGWFNQIAASDDARQFLANAAADPFPGTPESMASLLKADIERWGRYVKLANIPAQ